MKAQASICRESWGLQASPPPKSKQVSEIVNISLISGPNLFHQTNQPISWLLCIYLRLLSKTTHGTDFQCYDGELYYMANFDILLQVCIISVYSEFQVTCCVWWLQITRATKKTLDAHWTTYVLFGVAGTCGRRLMSDVWISKESVPYSLRCVFLWIVHVYRMLFYVVRSLLE